MCGTGCVMDTVFILSNCIETQELEFSLFSEIKLRLRNDVYQDAPMVQTHGRCSVYSYSFHFPLPPSFPPPPSLHPGLPSPNLGTSSWDSVLVLFS